MSNIESGQQKKEKLLRWLRSLSPAARIAILTAVLERKALKACPEESEGIVEHNKLSKTVK